MRFNPIFWFIICRNFFALNISGKKDDSKYVNVYCTGRIRMTKNSTGKSKTKMPKGFNNVALLTSGGDAPGMNPCIRAGVRTGRYHGFAVFGVKKGFGGLICGGIDQFGSRDVGGIFYRGGTILGTNRCPEILKE